MRKCIPNMYTNSFVLNFYLNYTKNFEYSLVTAFCM